MYIVIFRWVGAGLRDCWLLAIIVCETRPYSLVRAGLRDCWLFTIIICETRPYRLNIKNQCEDFSLGGGGFERLLVIYNYCL